MNYKDYVVESKLKKFRKLAKLSQQELAARVGCSDTMIQEIEYNHLAPNLKLAFAICDELEKELGYPINITMIFVNYSKFY